ncbi:GIY-YIG nuclease family protein [Paraburkholderia panacisoli]|uniref:GIY-YIG nuclease family protein n=1 Tax=Paraburkholderia panacisoli TaxID=2603818 RepID=A0A5B0HDC9_9BURK|nr:GIY-YIG nuclease family protein [Paraburkholderia panacisoli]KAA1013048.1 GIY-YIG nuclease family protein [Paraburkholderia panacisoli]
MNSLSAEHIAGLAQSVKKTCGVYVLMRAGEIVYVGQSINCNLRIGSHLNDAGKMFDSYFVIECPEDNLNEVEARYIAKFGPKHNVIMPLGGGDDRVRSMYRIPKDVDDWLQDKATRNGTSKNIELVAALRKLREIEGQKEKAPNA